MEVIDFLLYLYLMKQGEKISGRVVRYLEDKNYGFIESDKGDTFYFKNDRKRQKELKREGKIDKVHNFSSGDEVTFIPTKSPDPELGALASEVRFVGNTGITILAHESDQKGVLQGTLKKMEDDSWFVIHTTTGVYVPLSISNWEIDLEKTYESRVDQLVGFKLTQTHSLDKLSAILSDRKFSPNFQLLRDHYDDQTTLKVTITGKNQHGYFAKLSFGDFVGFIKLDKSASRFQADEYKQLQKDQEVWVKLQRLQENQVQLPLSFYGLEE
jgi:cold shock CspA family protein